MKTITSIQKQYHLILEFFNTEEKEVTLSVFFQNKKTALLNPEYLRPKRFIDDQPIKSGDLLGKGGSKRVYDIDGKAVFLLACSDVTTLERMIDEEVSISHQISLLGLNTQTLHKASIGIYDPSQNCYIDYPCMYADSFSKLSTDKKMEIFDIKNRYRFGTKYKLFQSDDGCMNATTAISTFEGLANDLALLLYFGFAVNLQDSLNLAFMPSNHNACSSTVRLFLYDFSSKNHTPKIGPTPINRLPGEGIIKNLLKNVIHNALEADHIARTGRNHVGTAQFILNFFATIYPEVENVLINVINSKILKCMQTKNKFEDRVMPRLIESTQMKDLLNRFGFYTESKKMTEVGRERSNSCNF